VVTDDAQGLDQLQEMLLSQMAGRPALVSETAFAGYPLKALQYDINAVGAGGGSIAHSEADGILRVGPLSAGARPGPASYGHGGTQPTVTDANLPLGRLGTTRRLGGSIDLKRDRARETVGNVAERLGLPVDELAEGILHVTVARMAGAIRAITVERGHDPADFALLPFGGTGAMHACDLAEELGIREVVVAVCPGNLSALGLLASDLRQEWPRRHDWRHRDRHAAQRRHRRYREADAAAAGARRPHASGHRHARGFACAAWYRPGRSTIAPCSAPAQVSPVRPSSKSTMPPASSCRIGAARSMTGAICA
jgi:N-methylhydantoinase A/oxoprolinase/acetone carboxylase beta subunit